MKVELKNIKRAAFASQETDCFEASVCIDGVRAGTVSNEGCGGENRYQPYGLADQLNVYAKTLPQCSFNDGEGNPVMMDMNADLVIGELFEQAMLLKELKRLTSSGRLVYVQDGKLYRSARKYDAKSLAYHLSRPEQTLEALKGEHLLNGMDPEVAVLALCDIKAFLAKVTPPADEIAPFAPGSSL